MITPVINENQYAISEIINKIKLLQLKASVVLVQGH